VARNCTIAGAADGKSLGMGENQIAKVHVDATVASPLDPDGKIEPLRTQVTVGGQTFSKMTLMHPATRPSIAWQ
jgi:hypothetical protein